MEQVSELLPVAAPYQVSEIIPVAAPYHVFINHRTDVKKTFASLIYNRLTECHGLCVFLDEKEIRTGDSLSPAIIGAIKLATVHVAIFSRRYAESSWCLEELHLILRSYREGKAKIVPVFFGVEPKDLRHIESGLDLIGFEKYVQRSPTHREPSTAIFSGRASLYTIFGKGDMLRITEKFNLQMHEIVFQDIGQPPVYQRLETMTNRDSLVSYLDGVGTVEHLWSTPSPKTEVEDAYMYLCGQKALVCLKSTASIAISLYPSL